MNDRSVSNSAAPVRVFFALSAWKRTVLAEYLADQPGEILYSRDPRKAVALARDGGGTVYCWGARGRARLAPWIGRDDRLIVVEDGFVRSSGLGGAYGQFPASLCFDDMGVYYDPAQPSRLEHIIANETPDAEELAAARALIELLVTARVTKYNLTGSAELLRPPADRKTILVPGQVEGDQSVVLGGLGITRNRELLRAVRESEPDAWIVFKPHPDVLHGYRRGHVPERLARRWCDAVAREQPISDLYDVVDEVHTLTSQAGFEALLRGKAVTVHGGPFYAGWGLTADRHSFPRRHAVPLENLVWGALMRYPRYLNPVTRRLTGALELVRAFAEGLRTPRVPAPLYARLYHRFMPPSRLLARRLFTGV